MTPLRETLLGGCLIRLSGLLLTAALLAPPTASADAVRLRNGAGYKGTVVEYTDEYVVVRTDTGQRRRVEWSQLAYLEVEYLESYRRGLSLLAEDKPLEAADLLDDAVRNETRPWARALAVGALMRAYTQASHYRLALERLGTVLRNDPELRLEWSQLPVWWYAKPAPEDAVEAAVSLLSAPQAEVAVTAASYVLASPRRRLARGTLRAYEDDQDRTRRVYSRSLLALHGARDADPVGWQSEIDALPLRQQPGPLLALAQTLTRQNQLRQAVHVYLRVAFVHPEQRRMAPYALWEAARLLERSGRANAAITLYRELRKRYPQSPEAHAAEAENKGGRSP